VLEYRLTTPAKRDLAGILNYLVREAGGKIAVRTEAELRAGFQAIAMNPGLGHLRQDLTEHSILFHGVPPYLILYREEASVVMIHAILHGSRDAKLILKRRRL
jgi:antitoxin ParD1/3/4/toxin ParE1/3/4